MNEKIQMNCFLNNKCWIWTTFKGKNMIKNWNLISTSRPRYDPQENELLSVVLNCLIRFCKQFIYFIKLFSLCRITKFLRKNNVFTMFLKRHQGTKILKFQGFWNEKRNSIGLKTFSYLKFFKMYGYKRKKHVLNILTVKARWRIILISLFEFSRDKGKNGIKLFKKPIPMKVRYTEYVPSL